MKKIKKLLPVLLMSIMSVSAFAADAVVDGIAYYFIDESLEAQVARNYENPYSGDITIPETVDYDGKTYSVTSIGEEAFSWCSGLTSITIPNSVTSIGINAFSGCEGLTSVTIPNSVTSIGRHAFYGCTGLTSVTIPNSVTSIGKYAFSGCTGLESIIVEDGNTVYDSRNNCNAIIETETNTLLRGCNNTVIPGSVTSIVEYALYDCKGLTSVTIPNSVTSIGEYALYGCTGLTSVTIPNSVTSIGECAFGGCSALESIIVEEGNTIYDSRENCNAIIETETNMLLQGCKNTVIPGSVTSIGGLAFRKCVDLTSLTIPNSVTSIGEEAFSGCTGLTSLTIPNSVTSIGEYALYGCTGLTSLTIPNSVTSIGGAAFRGCTGLESIIVEDGNTVYDSRNNCNAIIETETNTLLQGCNNTVIPGSVTSIGIGAFYHCKGLTSVTIPNSVTSIDIWAFNGCTGLTSVISMIEEPFEIFENVFSNYNATLYVPAGTKEKYEGMPAWNMFKNIVEGIENAVKSVETDAQAGETERYNVSGQRISSPQKGLNIVKMSDGTTRKIMCK